MHLRQPGFTYRACGPYTINEEKIKKIKETRDSRHIYQNELERIVADEVLHDKAFNIAKNPKYDGF